MRKSVFRLGAGVLGAVLLLPGAALAGHYGHVVPGSVTTITYTTTHVRGGPPAWAPAHGYRQKRAPRHRVRHYKGYRQPVVVYPAPVHRAPAYRAPATVYHGPAGHSTLDFSIRYRTRF
ncbi:hypothetical protein [Thioalkalivibrio thiocyanodenitrificans]|uniref:hypothetical protein n=1 Tax=Thioalkalivibrio thiocyanodenitrificans TaxID=243063 RepID=UPI00035F0775|nr:hypothetical protein [Thioalkalivibrio thiocyanodenitrificans]